MNDKTNRVKIFDMFNLYFCVENDFKSTSPVSDASHADQPLPRKTTTTLHGRTVPNTAGRGIV